MPYSSIHFNAGCGTRNQALLDSSPSDNDITMHPWTVSIGETNDSGIWEHKCSGSIITEKHILTTANCLRGNEGFIKLER